MNRRDAVCAVRPHDRKIGHADFAPGVFLNEAYGPKYFLVTWKTTTNVIKEPPVDLVNDLQLTREYGFKPLDRPFLQCFRQQSVVCISQRISCDFPGIVPGQMCFV